MCDGWLLEMTGFPVAWISRRLVALLLRLVALGPEEQVDDPFGASVSSAVSRKTHRHTLTVPSEPG